MNGEPMRRLLAMLVIAGCSSETGGDGQATTITDADLVVASITHGPVAITVYKTGDFLMTGNCRGWRGKITEAELATFKSHMSDAVIQTLGKECGEDEYRIRIGGRQSVCWTKEQKAPALEGLTAFFDEKAAMHAQIPPGGCDSEPQDIGEVGWEGKKAAAGSGG